MKSKASYFSISMPLIKENLRRFWAIPVIGFLAYFLSGIFPILMSYNNINNMYSYIRMCLINQQPFFLAAHLIMPVITAVIIFRYMQNSGSVTAIHSMPFTRSQLFNSNLLSGFILITLPLLASEIIFQVIAKPTYDYYMYADFEKMKGLSDTAIDVFTRSNVLSWFWQSLLIVTVIYMISVFAGMVTGNAVMHLALSFGFNFLAPALYLTFISYCSSYLFGFTVAGTHEDVLLGLSPFTQAFASEGTFTLPLQVYYLLLSLALVIISHVLYKKRALEKAGDSIVFNIMTPVICYLIAYFGMSLMGSYFKSVGYNYQEPHQSDIFFYWGLAAGAVIAFIMGRMIVLKTPRIFNKSTLKSFCIFTVAAVLFIASITLDLTGFEDRVPNPHKVSGVYFSNFDFSNNSPIYDAELFGTDSSNSKNGNLYFSDPKNIDALISLHQDAVKNKDIIEKESNTNVRSSQINLDYDVPSPLGMQRSYSFTYDRLKHNKALKQVYESLEFKSYFSLKNLNSDTFTKVTLENNFLQSRFLTEKLTINSEEDIKSLIKALEQDFQDRTYEEYIDNIHSYCDLFLNYKYVDKNDKLTENILTFSVLLSDENTLAWLADNGYSQYLECSVDMIEKIVFTEHSVEKEKKKATSASRDQVVDEEKNVDEKSDQIVEPEYKQLVITDKAQIQEVLNTYNLTETNYSEYYQGRIVYKNLDQDTEIHWDAIYYDFDRSPKFISEFFN